ncbi:MAG: TetR/AcrR family transcriptional regulator C-terminal domain-containing protein [Lactimicrobium sp.]|uniref:TetR/AcrR family transcriptional regulator C-terminal domain-containing protein n=1 Tax=Lactimicrobium sp. TaxID=2563780 RepID=UPI002F35BBB9
MKTSLAENLRVLMTRKLFEKITIKQICDETGVIRATFYNYFDDKYDCLNWIVHTDLLGDKQAMVTGNFNLFIDSALNNIEKNRAFYRAAYNVTGQNSFEDMIRSNLSEAMMEFFDENRKMDYMPAYSNELLARYYAEGFAFIIRQFVFAPQGASEATYRRMVIDLLNHSFGDYIARR